MNTRRKNELLANTLEWFLENIKDDHVLYNTLHEVIGWQKSELHDFSIESLDEYFDEQEEEAVDMITAEDLAEQLVYATFAPECTTEEERTENMLKMLGANIVDTELFTEVSYHLADDTAIECVLRYGMDHHQDGTFVINDELCNRLTSGIFSSPYDCHELFKGHMAVKDVEYLDDGIAITLSQKYIEDFENRRLNCDGGEDEGFTQSM